MIAVEPSAGDRPRVGISRCLLGDEVRHDGRHRRDDPLLAALGGAVEWVSVCPEVEVGMGIPREPIHLVAAPGGAPADRRRVRLLGVGSGRDWTDAMHAWAAARVRELERLDLAGFILKSESPSCGLTVPVHHGGPHAGRGLFAEALAEAMPDLPVEEESRLADPGARERFRDRVFARHRARRARAPATTGPRLAVDVVRVSGPGVERARDVAAAEEPLEIRLDGAPFAVIMRTPGADRELAAGFLLAERIIADADDLGTIRHCTGAGGEEAPNVIDVVLAGPASGRAAARLAWRPVTATSACGVCGRRTIDDLLTGVEPLPFAWRVPRRVIAGLPGALRAVQHVFDDTGGLHAAGLFDRFGALVASAEDVGRHNAVDKVVGGQLLRERLPLAERILFVSGRTSYEIVQKALVARIPVVASVSAPSSLAIDLARGARLTLLGFVRGDAFNVYAGDGRLELP